MNAAETAALLFGDAGLPRALTGVTALHIDGPETIDTAVARFPRLVVVGTDPDLAAVLTRLLRAERLDVQVGYVPRRRTAATRAYRLAAGHRAARRALRGTAQRVPLVRDDTGVVLVGRAGWRGVDAPLHGEGVVDDAVLFDGDVAGVVIEPTATLPGLRARVAGRRRWICGRAVQLGTTGAVVVRDGLPGPRPVKRSTFYRHTQGWLLVR